MQPDGKESGSESDTDGDGIPDDLESTGDYDGDKDGNSFPDNQEVEVRIGRVSTNDDNESNRDSHYDDVYFSSEGIG